MISEQDKIWVKQFANELASKMALSESRLRVILGEAFKLKDKAEAIRYIEEKVWGLFADMAYEVASIAEEKNEVSLPAVFVAGYLASARDEFNSKLRKYAEQFFEEVHGRAKLPSFYKPRIDVAALKAAKAIAGLPILAKSSITNLKVLLSRSIADVMAKSDMFLMSGRGAYGYIGVRMSSYPCELCDSLCGYIIPIDQQVFPAHPRCVCAMIPVTE